MRKKRTQITVETEHLLVIRRTGKLARAWCAECAAQVRMITPEEAAITAGVTSRTIYRWVEAEKLHFAETPEGLLRICLNSLM